MITAEHQDSGTRSKRANWEQFKALVWLRWRIFKNQMARTGKLNLIFAMVLVWSLLVLASMSLFVSFGLGVFFLPSANPFHAMIIWDILVLVFALAWIVSLVTELQKTEFLSLSKLLQLPMSFTGAFTLNYLTSLLSISVLCFVPTAIGLSLAFAVVHGPLMLLLIPTSVAVVLLVSAVSYQFQSWLGSIMQNERKRRSVVVAMTILLVVIAQVPNLAFQFSIRKGSEIEDQQATAMKELTQKLESGEIALADFETEKLSLEEEFENMRVAAKKARELRWDQLLTTANTWIPLGWPAVVCKQLLNSDLRMFAVAMFCLLGGSALSLKQSYQSTMRSYTLAADGSSRESRVDASNTKSQRRNWLSKQLPFMSVQQSTIVTASMLNMIRTPEAKMALVGPLVMACVFGAIFLTRRNSLAIPSGFEPLALLAGVALIMFGATIMAMNVFGMDRNSFKALVLMPVRRADILLGKNIAIGLFTAPMLVPILVLVYFVVPNSFVHILATLLQAFVVFVSICMMGNPISIWFPIPMASGGQPAQFNFKVVFAQMGGLCAYGLFFLPALAAIALELLLSRFFGIRYLPIYLLASIVEVALVVFLYRWAIRIQGDLLQKRETMIIDALKSGSE